MGVFKKRGKYWIDYYALGRRRRECVGEVPRRMAEQALKARLGQVAEGRFHLIHTRRFPRFTEVVGNYLKHVEIDAAPSNRSTLRLIAERLRKRFGKFRTNEINSLHVEAFKREEAARVSPATVNRYLGVLKRIFNLAIRVGMAEGNPVRDVRYLKERGPVERILISDEEARLVAASSPHIRSLILLALNTGMRRGELLQLRWDDVDPAGAHLRIRKETTKGDSERKIPLNEIALRALRELPRSGEFVFGWRGRDGIKTTRRGFEAACRRAGIRGLRFHDLRHTFATRLTMRNCDLRTVQELLGHATIQMTVRYSHPTPAHKRDAVGMLNEGASATVHLFPMSGAQRVAE